jgi:hypothetical protein
VPDANGSFRQQTTGQPFDLTTQIPSACSLLIGRAVSFPILVRRSNRSNLVVIDRGNCSSILGAVPSSFPGRAKATVLLLRDDRNWRLSAEDMNSETTRHPAAAPSKIEGRHGQEISDPTTAASAATASPSPIVAVEELQKGRCRASLRRRRLRVRIPPRKQLRTTYLQESHRLIIIAAGAQRQHDPSGLIRRQDMACVTPFPLKRYPAKHHYDVTMPIRPSPPSREFLF